MKRYVLGAAAALLLGGPAAAQMQMAPSGVPMTAPMSGPQFRQMVMFSDAFEIESSRLALQRSRNSAVRRYAQLMIRDHSATTQALGGPAPMAAAPGGPVGALVAAPFQAAGAVAGATAGAVAGAPAGAPAMALDARHAQMLNQLAATSGRAFDATYAQMQVMAHQEAVGMFSAYAQAGDQPSLRNFAGQVLPNLQHHLAMAQRLSGRRS